MDKRLQFDHELDYQHFVANESGFTALSSSVSYNSPHVVLIVMVNAGGTMEVLFLLYPRNSTEIDPFINLSVVCFTHFEKSCDIIFACA